MEILKSFIVKYDKSKNPDHLSILIQTKESFYIQFVIDDGVGWHIHLEEIGSIEAEKLII